MTTADETFTPEKRRSAPTRRLNKSAGPFGELSSAMSGTVLILYAISITWPIKFQIGPLFITFSRIMIIALMATMVLRLISGRYGGIKAPDYLIVIYLIWSFIAMSVNHGMINVIESSGMYFIETFGAYLIGRIFIRNAQDFYTFIRYLVISILISIPFVLVELFSGEPFLVDLLRSVNPLPGIFKFAETIDYPTRLGLHRVQYTLPHPILFGMFCSSLVALTLMVMSYQATLGKTSFWTGVVIFGTLAALSSAGWLSAMLQIAILVYERMTRFIMKYRWKLILFGFIGLYIFLEIFSNRDPLVVMSTAFALNKQTAYMRILIFEHGMNNVWANPIFGIGNNDWVRDAWMPPSVDNHWLLTAMRYGFPGFFLMVISIAPAIYSVGRSNVADNPVLRACKMGYMACMIGWIITMCTVWISVEINSLFMTMLGAGYWIADQARAEVDPSSDPRARRGRSQADRGARANTSVDKPDRKSSRDGSREERDTRIKRPLRARPDPRVARRATRS